MKTKVSFIISAALEQTSNGRVVINGFYLMQVTKTWYGKERYRVVNQYETAALAVAELNKILGYKKI